MKSCVICGRYLDESLFARRNDDRADGYQAHCLECQSAKNRAFYAANRERIKARNLERIQAIRDGRLTVNPESPQRRTKHPPPPPPKRAYTLVMARLDDDEIAFLEEEREKRWLGENDYNEILRELVRAGIAAKARAEESRNYSQRKRRA